MEHKTTCPVCGSSKITRVEENNFAELTLGRKFYFKDINYKCGTCHEEGDFFAESDRYFLAAQKEAESELVKELIENINALGITMALFERVFELPMRTLTRWKNGDFSSAALALLRIIITFPWIVRAAEQRFEKTYSHGLIVAAAQEFQKETKFSQSQIAITTGGTSQFSTVSNISSIMMSGG